MPRATYGPEVKKRALRLLEVMLRYVNNELDDDRAAQRSKISYKWGDERNQAYELRVETTLRDLENLSLVHTDGKLTKTQIREALQRMKDFVGILEDQRVHERGAEDWHFVLQLWSRHTEENLQAFDQAWERQRPAKSKRAEEKPVQQPSRVRSGLRVGAPLQARSLPHYFVDRSKPMQEVKELLLDAQPNTPGTLVVSAIYGLGGVGKSVLAAALAHDPEVQVRFADGILWATLGQEPDILPFLSDWIQALGDKDFKPTTQESASNHLRTLLYDKQVLLVVDDAWNTDHVEPFRVGGTGCRVLVTTREARVPGAKRYDMEVMTPEQALQLMQKARRGQCTEAELQQMQALADAVGYLPLALELATALVEDGVTWTELLEDLQTEIARLESFEVLSASDSKEVTRKRLSLRASFNLSLQRLTPDQQRQFAWLGTFPEDISITETVAATLWHLNPRQAGTALRILWSRALLLTGARQPDEKPTYRLHDLMHDMAKRLLTSTPTPTDPKELPGLGLTRQMAHTQFLQSYRSKTKNGQWYTLPDDGYIHAHLTWHFQQAGQVAMVHQLLQEETEAGRNGWFEACEAIGQTANFVTDVARAWAITEKLYAEEPGKAIGLQCRYALIRASLNSLASNIPPELIAALVEKGYWQPAQGLAYAQQNQEARQKAAAIAKIAPHLSPDLLPKAIQVAQQIQEEYLRALALSALIPHLPPELLPEALQVTQQIQSEYFRAITLRDLTPYLPDLAPQALQAARQIQDQSVRASALSTLIPHLPPTLLPKILQVARQIQDQSARARALTALIPHFPDLALQALQVAQQIQDQSARARALTALIPHFPDLAPQALQAVQQIQSEFFRASALSTLIPHLPPTLLPEILQAARQIQFEFDRASLLCTLIPRLPPTLLPEILQVAQHIQSEPDQVKVLTALIPHFPDLAPQALQVTQWIQSEYYRASALGDLTPNLPPALLPEALQVAQQIQSESDQANAFTALISHLPDLAPQTLQDTQRIQSKYHQASVLSTLIPHLPPELLPEALQVAQQIQSESDRVKVLSTLIPHLPPELLPEVLQVAQQIQSESDRVKVLSTLIPHLPPELLPEVLQVAQQIQSEYYRTSALSTLIPHFPDLAPQTLQVAQQVQGQFARASALSALIPHFPDLAPQTLQDTQQIQSEYHQASVLSTLIPHLPPELLPEVLQVAQQIQSESDRVKVLSTLIPHLPPELLSEVLQVAQQIQSEPDRVKVLSTLIPHLPPELLPEVLQVAQQIQSEPDRVKVLSTLIPHVPDFALETLQVTQQIQDWSDQVKALRGLIPHLPVTLLPKVLQVAQQIQSEYYRASALRALIPHLPPELLSESLQATQQIQDKYYQAISFQGFAGRANLSLSFNQWCEMIDSLSHLKRTELLPTLAQLHKPITDLGGEVALKELVQSIQDICRQWR